MQKEELLFKLTGTETPRFITERENVMIDKFLEILEDVELSNSATTIVRCESKFSYVDITTKGCEGWINLFFDGEIIALIRNVAMAKEIKKEINVLST